MRILDLKVFAVVGQMGKAGAKNRMRVRTMRCKSGMKMCVCVLWDVLMEVSIGSGRTGALESMVSEFRLGKECEMHTWIDSCSS